MRFLIAGLFCVALTGFAATTEFTYQGQLKQNGAPATGSFNIDFKLFDASTAGTQQGSTVSKTGVAASNGLFVVTLDFGQSVFSGADRYLEVGVNGSVLATRQKLTPTPMAIIANKLSEQPKVKVFSTGTQSIPSLGPAETILTFDSEEYDDFGMHAGAPSQIIIPEFGVYRISANVTISDSTSTSIQTIDIRKNGQRIAQKQEFIGANMSANLEINRDFKLFSGDIIECSVYNNSGTVRNTITDATNRTSLSVTKLP